MRQSMSCMQRTRAQASFAGAMAPSLRNVALAVGDVLGDIPRTTTWSIANFSTPRERGSWLSRVRVHSCARVREEGVLGGHRAREWLRANSSSNERSFLAQLRAGRVTASREDVQPSHFHDVRGGRRSRYRVPRSLLSFLCL